jgi:hypothetical protein
MEAALDTVAEAGAGTIAVIHVFEMVTAPIAAFQILGKRGTNGYELYMNTSGHIITFADSDVGTINNVVATDHGTGTAEVVLFKRSETDAETGLHTRLGSSTLAAPGGTMVDTKLFSVGRNFRSAANCRHAMTLIWLGSSGDGFGADERTALAQALGHS